VNILPRYGKKTRLGSLDVIQQAIIFFRDGNGMEIVKQEDEVVCFEGGGGHVTVTVCEGKMTDVEIVTREWDYQVKEFMREL
jgi:hypothetical protein